MSDAIDDLTLAADFAPATEADWRKLVDGVLKGAPFEKLVSKTYDGVAIAPLYPRAAKAAPVAGRDAGAPWQVMQRVDNPDAKAANRQALHDLENGATGLTLVFTGANGARGLGLDATPETIAAVLDGIYLDAGIGIELNVGPEARMAVVYLADYIKAKGIDPAACNIRFGLDPIGASAVWGSSSHNWKDLAAAFTKTITTLKDAGFKGPFAVADGRIIHDAGGSEAQELAYVLSVAVLYLRVLEWTGMPLDEARGMIAARLSADADQFLTMAKFRALRRLWARVEESCGLPPAPLFIAAETAWRMLTQRDPYVNMLRATMATFAAGIAGANAITVLPHTLALGLPDAFARRAARNTQLVLLEESNLAKVSDPAAGSGGIEALTSDLCTSAWTLFQTIEKAGGIFAALEQNVLQPKVAATRAARQASIAKRRDVLTGASEFPNLHEARAAVLKAKPRPATPYGKQTIKFNALTPMRLAEPFEALRDMSDHLLARKGARPKVFLANLGTPADFTARATFAKSFFETGGIEAVDYVPSSPLPSGERSMASVAKTSGEGASTGNSPSPAPSPSAQDRPLPMGEVKQDFSALITAFKDSGAALVCLCSSDKLYATQAAEAAKALHAAGAQHIYLAGRPGDHEAAYREAGVSDFIIAGGDALKTLQDAYAKLVTP
jgi:methylmalonyl-CoA mutase